MTAEIEEFYVFIKTVWSRNDRCSGTSSATAEDLPDASFAGQQETFLT
jgi:phosphoenolpyruvate synthase/pyruvate phosphate dikinase